MERLLGEDEAELADLGHHAAEEDRRPERQPQRPTEEGDRGALDDDGDEREGGDEEGTLEDCPWIDEHPDRDEEEHREEVAERDDFGGRL